MSNFSVPGENRGQKARHLNGGGSLLVAQAPIEVEHEGGWSREQLETMNNRFVAAVERAIALGLECRRADARISAPCKERAA